MNPVDLAFLLVVCVAWPAYIAVVRYPRLERALAAGRANARLAAYGEGIATQWVLAAAGVLLWLSLPGTGVGAARTLDGLGLVPRGGPGLWIGLGVTAAVTVLAVAQAASIVRSPAQREALRETLRSVSALLPRTPTERNVFLLVSLTAGICEEILFRGYLLGWLATWLGPYGGAAASSVVFGLAHAYQGRRGILQTGAVGAVLAALTLLTGSLYVPMLLHAVIDANSGRLAYRVLGENRSEL